MTETPDCTEVTLTEIDSWLRKDNTQLGEVFRYLENHPDATPTAVTEGSTLANTGVASNLMQIIKTIRAEQTLASPSLARQTRGRISTALKNNNFTPDTTEYLRTLSSQLDDVAQDTKLLEEQTRELTKNSAELEAKFEDDVEKGKGAVYVYSLPHYLNFPVAGENTYFKVGFSINDPEVRGSRVARQRTTAMPEDPVLLRLYRPVEGTSYEILNCFEKKFHKVLRAAGHTVPKNNEGGIEWFCTSLELLDTLALVFGMESTRIDREDKVGNA